MSNQHWKSLRDLREGPVARPEQLREFVDLNPSQATPSLDRRSFMGLMGASAALAGASTMTGCLRKDVEHILPYADRPEDLIPGAPRYFRTAMSVGDTVVGLHVASIDGRPIKIEGSPAHPMSKGSTDRWNQAAVINLYDPDRSQKVLNKGAESTSQKAYDALATLITQHSGGGGLGILVDGTPSPTLWRQIAELVEKHPKTSVYRHDLCQNRNQADALKALGLVGHSVHFDTAQADVVVVLDSDNFGGEGDSVSFSKGFAKKRKVSAPGQAMNRLYAAEPRFTVTGAMADHRLRLPGSHIGELLRGLADAALGGDAAAEIRGAIADRKNTEPGGLAWNEKFTRFVKAAGADLAAAKGRSLVVVGERQPAWIHALAVYLNDALGNTGKTVSYRAIGRPDYASIDTLGADLYQGKLSALVVIGASPVYDAPADLDFASRINKVQTLIHLGAYADETARLATWHIPMAHFLESWGDLVSADGTVAVQQPLLAPLYDAAISPVQFLGRLLGDPSPNAYVIVKATHIPNADVLGDNQWRRAVHDGTVSFGAPAAAAPELDLAGAAALFAADLGPTRPTAGALELNFILDPSVLDGRFANCGWLQELPDPMSKLTWDNAAFLSPATARELGVEESGQPVSSTEVTGELIEITLGGRTVQIVAWVLPGVADNVLILPMGYGRDLGFISKGAGFDVMPLRTSASPYIAYGATVTVLERKYVVATTQEFGSMVEPNTGVKREIVRESTLDGFVKDPLFAERVEILGREHLTSLWVPPNATGGQQWGLSIDLNTCTGCNVCTIACQAENNIPIVGKERVTNGREMHWIRLDRYFTGDENEPQAVVQPIACAQCEMAPCENVCPVAATTHSPEGLNDMAYNRCIGTRYCTNNCPFKVRRFNFFNYNKERQEKAPLEGMQHNPNVTVRFRGVVEKCTYCVQRINEAKIASKRVGKSTVDDGAIVPACAQACPSEAILFGDINDPNSRVTQAKKEPRNYELLRELNLGARTSFLAKLRNPNPALV